MANNPLFNMLTGNAPTPVNDMQKFISDLTNLKNSLQGDPRQRVTELMQSGVMSQSQFNQFRQMADTIYPLVKGRF